MRVTDAFYSRCAKGYYMRGRAAYGFNLEPIVMDGIKTKKLVENVQMVYVQDDMDIYEYFKAQGVEIESPTELFTGDYGCYLYQGREGEEPILVIAPHKGRIPSALWLAVQHKLSQNPSFQNGRKCHNTWLAGKIKCGCCG